jgi:hypothetical protein
MTSRTLRLRVDRVEAGRMDEFVAAWMASVLPLRRRFGFEIVGTWVDVERDEFCWVVGYAGPEGYDEAEAAYYASPERAAMHPDPGVLNRGSRYLTPASPA